ncbi:response regulator [Spirosoma aerophilum]
MPSSFPILLVDDDPNLLDILTQAAQRSFPEAFFTQVYSVDQAKNYLQNLESDKIKIVLLDINLEEAQSGIDLVTYIKDLPNTRLLPVVILTVMGDAQLIEQAYQEGIAAYHVKPFSLAEWRHYLATLRAYWYDLVKFPR